MARRVFAAWHRSTARRPSAVVAAIRLRDVLGVACRRLGVAGAASAVGVAAERRRCGRASSRPATAYPCAMAGAVVRVAVARRRKPARFRRHSGQGALRRRAQGAAFKPQADVDERAVSLAVRRLRAAASSPISPPASSVVVAPNAKDVGCDVEAALAVVARQAVPAPPPPRRRRARN